MRTRALNETFMADFLDGPLTPILDAVKTDDTLALELRGTYVNVYYRGGSLYRIEPQKRGYRFTFDTNYCLQREGLPEHPAVEEATELIYAYKAAMDRFLTVHHKMEREFQQLMSRINNEAASAAASDYYIIDIEYAWNNPAGGRMMFDMVAFQWKSTRQARKNLDTPLKLALIELKYGDASFGGAAGLEKHLRDAAAFFGNAEQLQAFCNDMLAVFQQKCTLGLMPAVKKHKRDICLTTEDPEFILALADHDPAKGGLASVLKSLDLKKYNCDIRLATASLLGGALFDDSMLTIPEFLEFDRRIRSKQLAAQESPSEA